MYFCAFSLSNALFCYTFVVVIVLTFYFILVFFPATFVYMLDLGNSCLHEQMIFITGLPDTYHHRGLRRLVRYKQLCFPKCRLCFPVTEIQICAMCMKQESITVPTWVSWELISKSLCTDLTCYVVNDKGVKKAIPTCSNKLYICNPVYAL